MALGLPEGGIRQYVLPLFHAQLKHDRTAQNMNSIPTQKKYLFFNTRQWGYASSYYQYAKILVSWNNSVTYLCFDHHLDKIDDNGVNVILLGFSGGFLQRQYRLQKTLISLIHRNKYDGILITYFPLLFITKILCPFYHIVLDIKTGYFQNNKIICWLQNSMIVWNSLFFKRISILSDRLRQRLKLSKKKCWSLPLGGERLPDITSKDYVSEIKCLYIGSFFKRDIDQTILGFSKFYEQVKGSIPVRYDIVGFGSSEDESKIRNAIKETNLNDVIFFHGRKSVEECKEYLRNANVGISYVPQTPFYDCQPPTKTFEYILSGNVCIGTATTENKLLINDINGILCQSNQQSFYEALLTFYNRRAQYRYQDIVETLHSYEYDQILINQLLPIFLSE